MEYNFYKSNRELHKLSVESLSGMWKQTTKVSLLFIVLFLIFVALSAMPYFIFNSLIFTIITSIISAYLLYILNYGWKRYCWNVATQKDVKLTLLFSGFGKPFFKLTLVLIKKFFLLLGWLMILVFPAFYKWLCYDMYHYIMIDDFKIVKDPISESIHIMKSNVFRLFKFYLSFLGWFLLGILSAGVGFVWLLPYFSVAKAHFYENLKTDF